MRLSLSAYETVNGRLKREIARYEKHLRDYAAESQHLAKMCEALESDYRALDPSSRR